MLRCSRSMPTSTARPSSTTTRPWRARARENSRSGACAPGSRSVSWWRPPAATTRCSGRAARRPRPWRAPTPRRWRQCRRRATASSSSRRRPILRWRSGAWRRRNCRQHWRDTPTRWVDVETCCSVVNCCPPFVALLSLIPPLIVLPLLMALSPFYNTDRSNNVPFESFLWHCTFL